MRKSTTSLRRTYAEELAVVSADGALYDTGPADGIYVCAGVTAPVLTWLDNLTAAGRLIVPMTTDTWRGRILRVVREASAYSARFIRSCGFIPCLGDRDSRSQALLAEAYRRDGFEAVRSLRLDPHLAEESCWLHDEKYCLSQTLH